MVHSSLFLYVFHRLVFPCSYLIGGTIPTSLLVLVETIFTPLLHELTQALPGLLDVCMYLCVGVSGAHVCSCSWVQECV